MCCVKSSGILIQIGVTEITRLLLDSLKLQLFGILFQSKLPCELQNLH